MSCVTDYEAFGLPEQLLMTQIQSYLHEKNYNTDFGDIIPLALAKVLGLNICTLDTEVDDHVVHHILDATPKAPSTLYLQRRGNHFTGIVPR